MNFWHSYFYEFGPFLKFLRGFPRKHFGFWRSSYCIAGVVDAAGVPTVVVVIPAAASILAATGVLAVSKFSFVSCVPGAVGVSAIAGVLHTADIPSLVGVFIFLVVDPMLLASLQLPGSLLLLAFLLLLAYLRLLVFLLLLSHNLSVFLKSCPSINVTSLLLIIITLKVYFVFYCVSHGYFGSEFRASICKPFREPRNRFPAWRAGTTTIFVVPARQATNACRIESS
jgi:hypothetical protein